MTQIPRPATALPVVDVRHAGGPASSLRPDGPGLAAAREAPGEPVPVKRADSGFTGTDLEVRLRAGGIVHPVIRGATINRCVETTTGMAGDLGFAPWLVRDAAWAYDRTGPDGDHRLAEAVHAMTLATLDAEFARIVRTHEVVAALKGPRALKGPHALDGPRGP